VSVTLVTNLAVLPVTLKLLSARSAVLFYLQNVTDFWLVSNYTAWQQTDMYKQHAWGCYTVVHWLKIAPVILQLRVTQLATMPPCRTKRVISY